MHRMMGPAFFLTLLFAALSSAHAQKDEGAVTFCFNNWPPYTQMVEGKPAGLSVEILREAAARGGVLNSVYRARPMRVSDTVTR